MTSTNTATATEVVLDDLPEAVRHPHLLALRLTRTSEHTGSCQWYYAPFTGTEARPERPEGLWDLDYLLHRVLNDIYDTMLGAWSKAKFTADLREPLAAAAAAWQVWQDAEQAMLAAYGVFDDLADGAWGAARLHLNDAQDAARDAAAGFDRTAHTLAKLQDEQWTDMRRAMGEEKAEDHYLFVSDIASELGVDTTEWVCESWAGAYTSSWGAPPLTDKAQKAIKAQNDRLDRVGDVDEGAEDDDTASQAADEARAEHDRAVAAYRAQIDRMQETIDGLGDDVRARTAQLAVARQELGEARAKLDAEDTQAHTSCAPAADLDSAKASATQAAAERDDARDEVRQLRLQRNVILVSAAVIIVVLTLAYFAR